MKKKSASDKLVRMKASEVPETTAEELAALRAASAGPIDTSDIPERTAKFPRARNERSAVRSAILNEIEKRNITRYQLWKRAQAHCPTLTESAVYEFLRGDRQIGLPYAEALMEAVDLTIARKHA
jgi:hypothetical protein